MAKPSARTRQRTTVPAHVDVDIPAVPTTTSVPPNLGKTLIWLLGTAVLFLTGWVSYILIVDHREATQARHDAQFVKREQMENHEREDIISMKSLSEQTNASIMKLTEAINAQSASAEVSRQWVRSSNLGVQSSVAELIARICRKDNANSKDPLVCDKEIKAADKASKQVDSQQEKANETTGAYQKIQIAPPVVVVPVPAAPPTRDKP